jgi:hypothetical protein
MKNQKFDLRFQRLARVFRPREATLRARARSAPVLVEDRRARVTVAL